MKDQTKISKDYLESFNQGYLLSKELNLKPEILEGLSAGNHRIQAMKEGMEQYQKDIEKSKTLDKDIIPPLDIDNIDTTYIDISIDKKEKDKGFDMDFS